MYVLEIVTHYASYFLLTALSMCDRSISTYCREYNIKHILLWNNFLLKISLQSLWLYCPPYPYWFFMMRMIIMSICRSGDRYDWYSFMFTMIVMILIGSSIPTSVALGITTLSLDVETLWFLVYLIILSIWSEEIWPGWWKSDHSYDCTYLKLVDRIRFWLFV